MLDAFAQLGDDMGGPAADKVHRALWCILHPFQCRRDPKTGAPRLALDDLVVLGVVAFAWLYFTRDG